MTDTFNDRYKINQILTVLFILGIGVSLFTIYSLPAGLRLADGYQPQFLKIYIIIGITFLVGAITLIGALRYKKEIIVFRDRSLDQTETETNDQTGRTTISLENIKSNIKQAKNLKEVLQSVLITICKQLEAGQGAVYVVSENDGKRIVELRSGYALNMGESTSISFEFGEGLVGQAAASGNTLSLDDIPKGYINIVSGLGNASPKYLLIVPIKLQEQVLGVMEIASFTNTSDDQRKFVEEAAHLIAENISSKA